MKLNSQTCQGIVVGGFYGTQIMQGRAVDPRTPEHSGV